ncbi:MAG: phosphonoacetaldehyde reductase [Succinivibrio sp.]|nr:phosphonoacetaldehyde reductase [Succinivibrio sp.]
MILNSYDDLEPYLKKKTLLVCGNSIKSLRIGNYLKNRTNVVRFSDFKPNPSYESVVNGVNVFHKEKCENIIAIGGGSAIDVAKCIKLFSNMPSDINYLQQKIVKNDVPLVAVPTTAGSGSEATHFSVVYYKNEKQSVSDESCIPTAVFFDATVLETLPLNQKKATMMDALCHAIEAYWSVNATSESMQYSDDAIKIIINNYKDYLSGNNAVNEAMLKASNLAGNAINIAKTTAGHAMSYKLTTVYNIPHGQAVALCLSQIWPYMFDYVSSNSVHSNSKENMMVIFSKIAKAMNCNLPEEAISRFQLLVKELELSVPKVNTTVDYEVLSSSVNTERLKNNPVVLSKDVIKSLYQKVMEF